jgi:uncharacterized protein YceK
MKLRVAQLLLLAAFFIGAVLISGCSTVESDNNSVRPWNAPQGWEGGQLNGMDYQHP